MKAPIFILRVVLAFLLCGVGLARAQSAEIIQEMSVRGNAKVESDAILMILKSRKADPIKPETIKEDIKTLYGLGYFSDVRIYRKEVDGGVHLIIDVKEKPAITSISFEGNSEISTDTLKEKLETKLYTIVNDGTITTDVRMIEKQYAEKGYHLVRVTYTFEKKGTSEVGLIFHVSEGGKVLVGSVDILGNKYFTTGEIINGAPGLASRPFTRASNLGSSSLYQEDLVKRDLEYLSYIYRDQGFAEVKVAKPFQLLDEDRRFARLTFQVEEGLQYSVGSIDVTGDLLFPKEDLIKEMKLTEGELFRYSRFARDIEALVEKYGDLGYAYADVDPQVEHDRDKRLVHIKYNITKGEKVYFGKMTIIGNTKTRDNVIRREFEVADSELYSGTGLTTTKNNANRLGFFEDVQIIKERDEQQQNLLNLKVKVKEKPTGQLQAALGFSPATNIQGSQWFGQGRYDEKNQSGKGWTSNLTARWNGESNYSFEGGFSDPRVNDTLWSSGINLFHSNERREDFSKVVITEKRTGGSVFIGRRLIELIRGRISYRLQNIQWDAGDTYIISRYQTTGVASSVIFSLLRTQVDNFIDPTDGSEVTLSHNFTGGKILRGDQQYMETTLDAIYYYPVDFTETYRTYFKLHGFVGYLMPFGDKPLPFFDRYRLGGFNDLRGYDFATIGPYISLLRSPGGRLSSVNKGGDKKMFYQFEYFMPLIPEAGIKSLVFYDAGRVFDESESLSLNDLRQDVGLGFRWITPIAPFRFEWAWPIEDGRLGNMKVIFYIGF